MTHRFHRRAALALLALVTLMALWIPLASASAGSQSLFWDRLDVRIEVLENGDMLFTEDWVVTFTSGTFRFGFHSIGTSRLDRIEDVRVTMDDFWLPPYSSGRKQGTTETEIDHNGDFIIRWHFPEPIGPSTHHFRIQYRVVGGLRAGTSSDQLFWEVIRGKNRDYPIKESTVRVVFPAGVSEFSGIGASLDKTEIRVTPEGEFLFTTENLYSGASLRIGVEFPNGALPVTRQAWQIEEESHLAQSASVTVALGAVGALLLLLCPLAVYLHWHSKGRDASTEPVPWTLAQPPSDLPPGLMGTLIDEHSDMKDTVATVIDLANRGVLRISETRESGKLDFKIEKVDPDQVLDRFERAIVLGLLGPKWSLTLSEIAGSFFNSVPKVQERMYQALVKRGYFAESPENTRRRYRNIGLGGLFVTLIIFLILIGAAARFTGLFWLPAAGLAAGFGGLIIVGRHMPRKTAKGSLEAQKWMAFRRYLEQLDKGRELEKSAEIFESYLPYAISFGMKNDWIDQFAALPAPAPQWYVPTGRPNWGDAYGLDLPSARGSIDLEDAPSLDDISDGLSRSLNSINTNFAAMLNLTGHSMGMHVPSAGDVSWSDAGGFDFDLGDLLELGLNIAGGIAEAGSGFG